MAPTNKLSIGVNFSVFLSYAKINYLLIVAYYSTFKANQTKNNQINKIPNNNSQLTTTFQPDIAILLSLIIVLVVLDVAMLLKNNALKKSYWV